MLRCGQNKVSFFPGGAAGWCRGIMGVQTARSPCGPVHPPISAFPAGKCKRNRERGSRDIPGFLRCTFQARNGHVSHTCSRDRVKHAPGRQTRPAALSRMRQRDRGRRIRAGPSGRARAFVTEGEESMDTETVTTQTAQRPMAPHRQAGRDYTRLAR